MRLLDLFCGAGGAAMGYARAGFTEIVGVDIKPQPRYPFECVQADALQVMDALLAGDSLHEGGHRNALRDFDAIHASPPCQAFSKARAVHRREHPDLLTPTRDRFEALTIPWVIENVVGAPMRADQMLCGSMFGLEVRRHRWFESNVDIGWPPYACNCRGEASKGNLFNLHNTPQRNRFMAKHNYPNQTAAIRGAYGVPWMTGKEAQLAIPPAYTEYIGSQLVTLLAETEEQRESA